MLDFRFARRTVTLLQARALRSAVERHTQNIWGADYSVLPPSSSSDGALNDVLVVRVPIPRGIVRCAYLTCGAALAGRGREREFLLFVREHDDVHVDSLRRAASAHFQRPEGLNHGDIVDLGRPWIEGASATRMFVTLPHRRSPPVGSFRFGDRAVQVLCLRPICDAEVAFALDQGCTALKRKLDESSSDLTDPFRPHVL